MMDDETLQDALDYCITNPEGLETEQLLGKFPELRDELVPLLALCGLISDSVPRVPQQRYLAMKSRVISAAMAKQQEPAASQVDQNGHVGEPAEATVPVVVAGQKSGVASAPPRGGAEERPQRRIFILDWLKRPALAAAFAAVLALFVWSASASAMSDSPFYRVRLLGESIAVNMETSPAGKVLKHNELANIRLREIDALEQRGKLSQVGPALSDYSAHLREGLSILLGTDFAEQLKTTLAEALYITCTRGGIEFDSLNDDVPALPELVGAGVEETRQLQARVRNDAAGVIEATTNVSPVIRLPQDIQSIVRQTPGPDATALATLVPQAVTGGGTSTPESSGQPTPDQGSAGSGSRDETATASATDTAVIAGAGGAATDTPMPEVSEARATATATGQTDSTATNTAQSLATATSTSEPETVETPTPSIGEQATATATPTEKPKKEATEMPKPGNPTEKPQPSRTPGRPPTHTPKPDNDKTPRPTDTPVPPLPSATPVPPSNTPTETPVVPPSNTPTTVPPSATPTLEPTATTGRSASACDVNVRSVSVSVSCDDRNCVEWTAQLTNAASQAVEITWVAEVEVQGAGGFTKVGEESNPVLIQPGEDEIGASFCDLDIPDDAREIRVLVRTDTGSAACDSRAQSGADPCVAEKAKPTKELEPTQEPKPTREPEPEGTEEPNEAGTPEPKPTKELEATEEPEATKESKPTKEPKPTKTPKPIPPPLPEPVPIPSVISL